MKFNELMPTNENLLDMFKNDSIGRNIDLYYFINLLNSLDNNASIALDGAWGSGKTFFVKQTKMILDAFNEFTDSNSFIDKHKDQIKSVLENLNRSINEELQKHMTVYYDCWENDNDDDPILSLIYSIVKSASTDYSFKDFEFVGKAAIILEIFNNREWKRIIEQMKSEDPLSEIKKEKNLQEKIKEFLDSLLSEKGDRLLIIVDELDRCNPNYAVKLLERIKHYFTNDRITFVFSINTSELQHTIRQHYGNNFDASRYLDRFFNLRIALPPADLDKYFTSLNFNNSNRIYDRVRFAIIGKYNFQLREISHFLNITELTTYKLLNSSRTFDFPNEKAEIFCTNYIIPLMIGLILSDTSKYKNFINGKDCTELLELLMNLGERYIYSLFEEDEFCNGKISTENSEIKEERIKQAYDAIFVKEYNDGTYYTAVGKCHFNKDIKNWLLKIVSSLSKYADYDL